MEKNKKELTITSKEIDKCIAVLESLNTNTNQIFEISKDKRTALIKAAGMFSRPNREEFSRRKKDAKKNEKRKKVAKDRHARKVTGIRSARET
ncbi:MAG: oxidoreductase, partial [Flavobacteriaceae bacterium]